MTYHLQTRWRLEGRKLYYYGLRPGKDMFRRTVRVTGKQAEIIATLPRELTEKERRILKRGRVLGRQVFTEELIRPVPRNLQEAHFCAQCCANDFIIPGLGFDENGLCPMCSSAKEVECLKSVLPLMDDFPRAKKSRFDVALFYTGGKDSTYMLHYLSRVKGLRVLALTWEIPFMSECARKSIEGAKKAFRNVEFVTRMINHEDMRKIYRRLYSLSGNTCACPSLAYVLFYPELVENRVPYFLAGNEPVQMLGLYYNHMAPKIAYTFAKNRLLTFLMNAGRVLTLRPTLRQGQFQTLMTMKQLAYGDSFVKKLSGYENELVGNIVTAIHEVPEILRPLRRAIRRSSRTGNVPAFVHVDLDRACGGKYDWNKVRDVLINECGWVPPEQEGKALHTSCQIEKCKDCSQFRRFYDCRSKMIPFSAIEISLASRSCGRTREEHIYEMENLLGFTLDELPECAIMRAYIEEEQ